MPLPEPLAEQLKQAVAQADVSPAPGPLLAPVAESILAWVDGELLRITEERFALGDASSTRQRLLADPRRQVDQATTALKSRFQNERSEWTRRIQKQATDVADSAEKELRGVSWETSLARQHAVTAVAEAWKVKYVQWLEGVLEQWGRHVGELLAARTRQALEPDLRNTSTLLGEAVAFNTPGGLQFNPGSSRLELDQLTEQVEMPTVAEAFTEIFKSAIGTVLMLVGVAATAGVGFTGLVDKLHGDQAGHASNALSGSQSMRGTGLAVLIVPVVAYAILQTRSHRRRLSVRQAEKAQEKLKKALETYTRARIDRFAKDVERFTGTWLQQAQQETATQVDGQVLSVFAKREASLASELARAQMQADKLGDQINALKQLRGTLSNSVLPETRRGR